MKKRTRVPYYGKRHQRAMAQVAALTNLGLLDKATPLRKYVSSDLKKLRGHA